MRRCARWTTRLARESGGHLKLLLLAAATAALISLAAWALASSPTVRALLHGDVRLLRIQLSGFGPWAAAILFGLVLLHTVLPFPAEILAAAGGFALGFELGLAVLMASFIISALLAYLIGARAGRPLLVALVGTRRLRAAEHFAERAGFRGLLAVRLIPFIPFSPLCLACGLASVPLRRFLWATGLGLLPELAVVTFVGSRLQSTDLRDPVIWLPAACIAALLLAGPLLLARDRH